MAEQNPKTKDNLINLAAERQRMQGRATLLRGKKLTKTQKGHDKTNKNGLLKWYHYLQLVLFLALVAFVSVFVSVWREKHPEKM